jgi:single-strand DNA-binding protein
MNKAILIGRLTRNPEEGVTKSGVNYAQFDLAVDRQYGGDEKVTDFFKCVAWRGLADNVAKYLVKGSEVCVLGTLQNRSYEDKDGNKRTITEIMTQEIDFLSKKKADEQEVKQEVKPVSTSKSVAKLTQVEDDDDLPF